MVKEFSCSDNLAQYIDSMLFDSGECIASMDYFDEETGKSVTLDLKVCGCVKVTFKETEYTHYSDFPEQLKKLIKKNREWDLDDRVYVDENNWFEYIFDVGGFSDGIMFESDLSTYTPDQLEKEMESVCKFVARR